MNFDPFVLPFTLGLLYLLVVLAYKYTSWIRQLPSEDKTLIKKNILSLKLLRSVKEVFTESLLHRSVFKVNPVLGFMHMSIAFGWFMLIVIGNVESRLYTDGGINMPYVSIFFEFFTHDKSSIPFSAEFSFLMDFFLLFVLTGILLAFVKRFYSKLLGMKKTTQLKAMDKFALYSLWLIFPLRLLAESFTSGLYHTGSFMTIPLGNFFASILPIDQLYYPTWWAYSLSLGIFFVALPYSRYMHIPTEVLFIFIRNCGVKIKQDYNSFSEIQVQSCSRCGICVDTCQLSSSASYKDAPSTYFIKSIRDNEVKEETALNCLLCKRCKEFCPVGIDTTDIRISKRKQFVSQNGFDYSYISTPSIKKADIIYFAGCMTHLTPSIKRSMVKILTQAKVRFFFMDEDGSICCGRPLQQAGNNIAAQQLMEQNKRIIEQSGAKTLVTSCPICYKAFTKDYKLNIEVLHHTQYLLQLAQENKIIIEKIDKTFVYHDPCELGRSSSIYEEPRTLLKKAANIIHLENEKEKALCCGGSLGNLQITAYKRDEITKDVVKELTSQHPDFIVTSCPLCKKTIAKSSPVAIKDIAEVIADTI